MIKATRKQVRAWCLNLVARQVTRLSVDDMEAQLVMTIPSLIARFPAAAFCQVSLDAVAATQRFWNEAGVTQALDSWTRLNLAPEGRTLPPEVEAAPVSDRAKMWLVGFYRATDDPGRIRALDLIRAKSDEAFNYLARTDTEAASIIVRRGWSTPVTRQDREIDWDGERSILDKARRIRALPRDTAYQAMLQDAALRLLVNAVTAYAPQHLPAMEAAFRSRPESVGIFG